MGFFSWMKRTDKDNLLHEKAFIAVVLEFSQCHGITIGCSPLSCRRRIPNQRRKHILHGPSLQRPHGPVFQPLKLLFEKSCNFRNILKLPD